MRIVRITFVSLLLLGSLSAIGDRKEVTRAKAEAVPPNPSLCQAIMGPVFVNFLPLGGGLLIREGDIIIVGEMKANCLPLPGAPQGASFSADPSFVTFEDDSCLCPTSGSKIRFLVRIAPQRGDAGKYRVAIRGSACGVSIIEPFFFRIKVKPAL